MSSIPFYLSQTTKVHIHTRAESVTETNIAIFKKTDTDVGIEKTENRRKNTEKNENSVFADYDLLISSTAVYAFLPLRLRTESNYYLDRLISDLSNGKETIIKRNKGQSNLAKAASPAHWRFGLQSSNLAPHDWWNGKA